MNESTTRRDLDLLTDGLKSHLKAGASWEGFVIQRVLATKRVAVDYPGNKRYPLSDTVAAASLAALMVRAGLFK